MICPTTGKSGALFARHAPRIRCAGEIDPGLFAAPAKPGPDCSSRDHHQRLYDGFSLDATFDADGETNAFGIAARCGTLIGSGAP
jgi:hypothetical protein